LDGVAVGAGAAEGEADFLGELGGGDFAGLALRAGCAVAAGGSGGTGIALRADDAQEPSMEARQPSSFRRKESSRHGWV